MSSVWVMDAESTIFTILEKKIEDKFKTKYADLFVTREKDNDELEKNLFPTVYVFFSETERGQDLYNDSIHAVFCTMEIQVISSKTLGLECAKEIIYYALDIAKKMRFNVGMMPEIVSETSTAKIMAMRLTRTIGYNDKIYF